MTPRASSDINTAQALGRLEGGMEGVQEAIRNLTAAIDSDRADAYRQRQASADRLAALEAVVASIRSDMDIVKPLALKWRRWQYIGLGVLMSVMAIGAAIGGLLQFFHDEFIRLLGLGK